MRFKTMTRNPLAIAALTAVLTATAAPVALADETVALKNALYGAGQVTMSITSIAPWTRQPARRSAPSRRTRAWT